MCASDEAILRTVQAAVAELTDHGFDVRAISPTSSLADLGLTSIDVVILIADMDEEYGASTDFASWIDQDGFEAIMDASPTCVANFIAERIRVSRR